MATTVKANGDWLVDVGDQLTQDFELTENGGPVDNWDDVVVQVDVFSARYGTLTLRSDDGVPQVIKQAAAPATTVSVTLTEADTSANYTAKYRIVVIDPTEEERTTHQAAGFRIVGNYADIAPISFSPVTTPIPDAVVSSTIDAYLAAYTPAFLDADDIGVTVEAAGAAAAAQAHAVQRSNHTGTQAQSTVTNLVSDLAAKASQASVDALSGTYLHDGATVTAAATPAAETQATTFAQSSNRWLALERYRVTGSTANTYDWNVPAPLRSGTYRFILLHDVWTDRAIYTVQIADVDEAGTVGPYSTLGTIDAYAAAAARTRDALTGLALTAGRKRIRFATPTKNAASTSHTFQFSAFIIERTGA